MIIGSGLGNRVVINQSDTIKPFEGIYGKSFPYIIEIDTNLSHFNWGIATKVTSDFTIIESLKIDLAGNIYAGGRIGDSIYNSFGVGMRSHGGPSDFFIAKIAAQNNCDCALAIPSMQIISLNNKILTVKGNATGLTDSLYWNWGDGSKTKYIVQNTNVSHTYTIGGNYSVCLKTYNNCGTKEVCLPVNSVGIEEQDLKYLNTYPNPVNNMLTIENFYQCRMQLKIFSITGKILFSKQYDDYTTSINMSNYERGIYFVEIILEDGRKTVRKVVRE